MWLTFDYWSLEIRQVCISLYYFSKTKHDTMAGRPGAGNAKVVLLGEGCVGKTSIVLRYVENKFNDKHEQTLQVSRLKVTQGG